uniref:Uncharacterized protein n=1 Tax=Branchiostoma floridae TaxID=7739 RepID=C3YF78_BRAFL|eukprot:XP_002605070.1 hypothetical protein BRAFLDRAFT_85216 [Branchiostoma floridae]
MSAPLTGRPGGGYDPRTPVGRFGGGYDPRTPVGRPGGGYDPRTPVGKPGGGYDPRTPVGKPGGGYQLPIAAETRRSRESRAARRLMVNAAPVYCPITRGVIIIAGV